ncbi:MAG: phosphagen kinase [Candidatus Altimarinota bacterium]
MSELQQGELLGLEISNRERRDPENSMLNHLTPELEAELIDKKTSHGVTLKDCVKVGFDHPDDPTGAYVGDAESYETFSPLFDSIIRDCHHIPADMEIKHKSDLDTSKIPNIDLDPTGERVLSVRIRVGRNLTKYPFPLAMSLEDRKNLQKDVADSLATFEGDLAGQFLSVDKMTDEEYDKLVAEHKLFKRQTVDKYMVSSGIAKNWPTGRGMFLSNDEKFLTWVEEEDNLRIVSMQKGGNVFEVFDRLVRAVNQMEKKFDFAYDEKRGYLTTCPTNLGTAMRASVHVKLPKLGSNEANLKAICKPLGLSVRGIHGEHSESSDGTFDISNTARLGISEVEIVNLMMEGVQKLLKLEDEAK